LDVTLGKTSWSEIDRAFQLRRAEGREWLLGAPAPADAPERRFLARIAKFDPLPYWKKSTRPVLAIFGEKDRIVPPDLTPNDRALLEGTNAQSRIVTIPAMNHAGLKALQGTSNEIPSLTHFAPGYWDAMSEYMAALTGEDGGK
jgi:pimeloyl-ACP methyl ester carboxylesterase